MSHPYPQPDYLPYLYSGEGSVKYPAKTFHPVFHPEPVKLVMDEEQEWSAWVVMICFCLMPLLVLLAKVLR